MIDLRFRRLTIFGHDARRTIDFTTGLNVVVGPYGSGKSSLLELLRFGLGGKALLSEAVRDGVSSVALEVSLAGSTYTLDRDMGANRIRVSQGGDPVTVLHTTSTNARGTVLASHFLLEALGLPIMKVRRSSNPSSTATEALSFWDLFRYVLVTQNDMGQSIAGHAESVLERKRRKTFELMFGLLDSRMAELEAEEARLTELAAAAGRRVDTVSDFLEATDVPTRGQLVASAAEAQARRERASASLHELRATARSASAELEADRSEIRALRAELAEVVSAASDLRFELHERARTVAQLTVDIDRSARAASAAQLLGPIEFTSCPRCVQSLPADRVSPDHCTLCTQTLPPAADEPRTASEVEHLQAVQAEVQDIIGLDEAALLVLERRAVDIRHRLTVAEDELGERTDGFVAPLFEQIESHAADIAAANSDLHRMQLLLTQWDARADLARDRDDLVDSIRDAAVELEAERRAKADRRELVDEFSTTFDEIVQELEIAWYSPAGISPTTYLPYVGQTKFEELSGGQRTVVSVAYHLALLTIGLVHPDVVDIPGVLILDTPSKFLGQKDAAQAARDYRRIAAIVDAYEWPLQVIVADNGEPPAGVNPANRIALTYEEPLVPGYDHPGAEHVRPIHEPYDEDEE